MDPVTFIVSAVALGAASGLTESAKAAVTDTFGCFLRLIRERYAKAGLEPVLDHPESPHKKGSLEEDLREAGAADDAELLAAARAVVEDDRIKQAAAQVVAVDLTEIKAQALTIVDVRSTHSAVRVHKAEIEREINIRDVRAGEGRQDPPVAPGQPDPGP